VVIPVPIRNLADFRRWALSDEFPETGRIDYIRGHIEVDMSPEDLFFHGTLKGQLYRRLAVRVEEQDLGHAFVDRTRVSCSEADLSAEPDVVVVLYEAIDSGAARLIRKASGAVGRYVEIEGAPDQVVEVISDSSVHKDTVRVPQAYFDAGVRECWLADARGEELVFAIQKRGHESFEPQLADETGFQRSEVMGCRYRLDRTQHVRGHWIYRLIEAD
jgi:Uma2 family endonuclease